MRLTLLIIIIILLHRIKSQNKIITRINTYNATPLCSIEKLLSKPGTFTDLLHFEINTFFKYILKPLNNIISLPRDAYIRNKPINKLRKCQINNINRIVRFVLRLRCIPFQMLAHYYDQDRTTVIRDFHHVARIVCQVLGKLHISPIIGYSQEYYNKIGCGVFQHFKRCLYAIDVVKVFI